MRWAQMNSARAGRRVPGVAAGAHDEPVIGGEVEQSLVDVLAGAAAHVPQQLVDGHAGVTLPAIACSEQTKAPRSRLG